MRAAIIGLLGLALADATPRNDSVDESKWREGDFVSTANQPLDRLVAAGDVVGLKISGWGESCLIRRSSYPLRLPCRLTYRVRWTEMKYDKAYPSIHVIFNPPALDHAWWKSPTTADGRGWSGGQETFLFHFATHPEWRVFGMTQEVESAPGRHGFSSPKGEWVDLVVRLDPDQVAVFHGSRELAKVKADLTRYARFTYAIGDQTSTFVELDAFQAAGP